MTALAIVSVIAAVLAVATPATADEAPWWSLGQAGTFTVGDFGTRRDATIVEQLVLAGASPVDRLSVTLTLPFVRQTAQTIVLTGGGVAVRRREEAQLGTGREPAVTRTEEGLGDVRLQLEYAAIEEATLLPALHGFLRLKFPTADPDLGLGTGKPDETLGIDAAKTLVERVHGYASVGYTFIGSPAGEQFHDSFAWAVGGGLEVTQPAVVFAFLDGATAISPGKQAPLDVRVGAEYRLTKAARLTGSVARGLSAGAADWAFLAKFVYRF